MRVLVDLGSHIVGPTPEITQVERNPPLGEEGLTTLNGKYLIPIVPGANVHIDENSYVLDGAGEIDGGDVSSQSMAWLLAMFPSFEYIYFNPLLTADHVGELDPTKTFIHDGYEYSSRFQTGRELGGPLPWGQAPCMTAVLAQNDTMTPARPGVMITDLIDISTQTAGVGTNEFLVYWKVYGFETTHDVYATHGALAGENNPALKYVEEIDQEPDGLEAYLTIDDGTHWCPVGLLEPVGFCDKTTEFRLAFTNTSDAKIYIATFAVMF